MHLNFKTNMMLSIIGFEPISLPGVVNYVGECGTEGYLCKRCEGDCDSDSDCANGLKCFQRDDDEAVPGCVGVGGSRDVIGKDICYDPNGQVVTLVHTSDCTKFFNTGKCKVCTGNCNRDSDCAGTSRCAQRYADTIVPGCQWSASDNIANCSAGSSSIKCSGEDYCKYHLATYYDILDMNRVRSECLLGLTVILRYFEASNIPSYLYMVY